MPKTTPDPAVEAYAVVHSEVYAPVFFNKLAADYGIVPVSDAECRKLMTMATKVRTIHDANQEKQAATKVSSRQMFLKAAENHLDQVLHQAGVSPPQVSGTDATKEAIKTAAIETALNPTIAAAVLQLMQE